MELAGSTGESRRRVWLRQPVADAICQPQDGRLAKALNGYVRAARLGSPSPTAEPTRFGRYTHAVSIIGLRRFPGSVTHTLGNGEETLAHSPMRATHTGRTKAETTEISNFKFEISDWGNGNGENYR